MIISACTRKSSHTNVEARVKPILEIVKIVIVISHAATRGWPCDLRRNTRCVDPRHKMGRAQRKERIGSTGVARERHGLFRCGAFGAACATPVDPKIFGPVFRSRPRARTLGRLTSTPLISSTRTVIFYWLDSYGPAMWLALLHTTG